MPYYATGRGWRAGSGTRNCQHAVCASNMGSSHVRRIGNTDDPHSIGGGLDSSAARNGGRSDACVTARVATAGISAAEHDRLGAALSVSSITRSANSLKLGAVLGVFQVVSVLSAILPFRSFIAL
jgi:hypothetical protein